MPVVSTFVLLAGHVGQFLDWLRPRLAPGEIETALGQHGGFAVPRGGPLAAISSDSGLGPRLGGARARGHCGARSRPRGPWRVHPRAVRARPLLPDALLLAPRRGHASWGVPSRLPLLGAAGEGHLRAPGTDGEGSPPRDDRRSHHPGGAGVDWLLDLRAFPHPSAGAWR